MGAYLGHYGNTHINYYSTRGVVECLIKHREKWSALSDTRPLLDLVIASAHASHNSYRVQSKWIRFVKCHSFSGEHREVGLRPTKDHTVDTFITTLNNFTIGKQARGEGKGERKKGGGGGGKGVYD